MKVLFPLLLLILVGFDVSTIFAGGYSRVEETDGDYYRPYHERREIYREFTPLSDDLHNEFMQNKQYAIADKMLNETWEQLKLELSHYSYEKLLLEQRQWINYERGIEAQRLSREMPLIQAYILTIQKRVRHLVKYISVIPRQGHYECGYGSFETVVSGSKIFMHGNALIGQNICEYEGLGDITKDWINIRTDGEDFYVLFTQNGARIFYVNETGYSLCGQGAYFSGSYTRK